MSRGLIFSVLLLVVGALGSRFLGAQAKYWTPDNFPNPNTDIDKCGRGVPSWICEWGVDCAADGRLRGSHAESILQKHQHLLHNSCSVPSQHRPSVLLT
jgi:hypothetical protein